MNLPVFLDRNGREVGLLAHVRDVTRPQGEDMGTLLWLDGRIAHLELDGLGGVADVGDLIVIPRDRQECARCTCNHLPDGCRCGGAGPVGAAFRKHARTWPCDRCGFEIELSIGAHPTLGDMLCGGYRCLRERP